MVAFAKGFRAFRGSTQNVRSRIANAYAIPAICRDAFTKSGAYPSGILIAKSIQMVDWRRALQLFAETMREIGILIVVFVPLDYVLAERPIGHRLAIVIVLSSIGIACAILIESIKSKS